MVDTANHGLLPVPKWIDDKRTDYALRAQAVNNRNSLGTMERYAQIHLQRQDPNNANNQNNGNNQNSVGGNDVTSGAAQTSNEVPNNDAGRVETHVTENADVVDIPSDAAMEVNDDVEMIDGNNESNVNDSNDAVYDYSRSLHNRNTNVLLIGLSYSSFILDQLSIENKISDIT